MPFISVAVTSVFALYIIWSAAKEPGTDQNWVWMKSTELVTSVSIAFIGKISIAAEHTLQCYSELSAFSVYRVELTNQLWQSHTPTSLLLSCRSATTALVIRKWRRNWRSFLLVYCPLERNFGKWYQKSMVMPTKLTFTWMWIKSRLIFPRSKHKGRAELSISQQEVSSKSLPFSYKKNLEIQLMKQSSQGWTKTLKYCGGIV